jgi:hypothetical protein
MFLLGELFEMQTPIPLSSNQRGAAKDEVNSH